MPTHAGPQFCLHVQCMPCVSTMEMEISTIAMRRRVECLHHNIFPIGQDTSIMAPGCLNGSTRFRCKSIPTHILITHARHHVHLYLIRPSPVPPGPFRHCRRFGRRNFRATGAGYFGGCIAHHAQQTATTGSATGRSRYASVSTR